MDNIKDLEEYIFHLDTAQRELAEENYEERKTYLLEENHKDYLTVDLSLFSERQKRMILTDTLEGMYFFHFNFVGRKVFPLGGFNEVINATKGKNKIQIYRKAFPRFRQETLDFLSRIVI